MTVDDATLRQISAADPGISTWLSANAGSGKTRVLTDRVARLLLRRVPPQNILCLTYTKAAASEMQNRLFRRLGAWAMLGDGDLRDALQELGIGQDLKAVDLAHARTLFARAIETPGGLKIQTIHSFCASLLRRFPMEAGVSPFFREIEDRSAKLLREEVVEDLADGPHLHVVEGVAQHYNGEDFDGLTAEIVRQRDGLGQIKGHDEIWKTFDLPVGMGEDALPPLAFDGSEAALFAEALPIIGAGSPTMVALAQALAGIDIANPDLAAYRTLCSLFLYGTKGITRPEAKTASIPTKKMQADLGDRLGLFHDLMDRVAEARSCLNMPPARNSAAGWTSTT